MKPLRGQKVFGDTPLARLAFPFDNILIGWRWGLNLTYLARRARAPRRRVIQSRRIQLGGGVLFAVVFPFALVQSAAPESAELLLGTSATGGLLAVLLGFYMFRNLAVFPGIRAGSYVLPSFAISYALVVTVFWGMRLDYSVVFFAAGFAACLVWYYLVFFIGNRDRSLRIGVVPFGEIDSLFQIGRVQWVSLTRADQSARSGCDAIVADFRADLPDEWQRFLADCALSGTLVYHVKELRESLTGQVEIGHLSENNFGSLIPALVYVKLKQMVDFLAALVALSLMLPFLVAVAGLIRFDSPGPVLFRQRRVGAGGHAFDVYKFRTMGREPLDQSTSEREGAITILGDARITRVGRLLRRSRIDELPQLINILKGEMSWIGPRPEAEVLSQWYEAELPFYRYRHIVKPGITGWAQVHQGHVAGVDDVLRKLQYDFFYIKNFSPWLDILITLKTFKTILTGHGSR